jgi:hypothetical protein
VPVPSIGEAWINAQDWNDAGPHDWQNYIKHMVDAGDIIETRRGDMVVPGIENRVLRVRPEQPADLWCEGGEPPAQTPWKEIRIPFAELFDAARSSADRRQIQTRLLRRPNYEDFLIVRSK